MTSSSLTHTNNGNIIGITEQVPSSYSALGYLVDGLASLVLLLTGKLVLGGGNGDGSAGQSAFDVTGVGGYCLSTPYCYRLS